MPVPPPQQQGVAPGEWPLRDFIEFGALPTAVPCARLHARQILWEWGITELRDSVELLVSELVTNAVAASQSLEWFSTVRLWLLSDRARVLILVWDANPEPPVLIELSVDEERGRGMALVAAISARWDWHESPSTNGKVVWALCTLDDAMGRADDTDVPDSDLPPADEQG